MRVGLGWDASFMEDFAHRHNSKIPAAAHAAADAHGHQAITTLAPLEFMDDADRQFRAGRAERMAERDGAAVDVDPVAAEFRTAG